jgi:hypothetical protein
MSCGVSSTYISCQTFIMSIKYNPSMNEHFILLYLLTFIDRISSFTIITSLNGFGVVIVHHCHSFNWHGTFIELHS